MPAGKVQPLAVRGDISGLRPLVSAPEVVDHILDVLPLFLSGVFADGKFTIDIFAGIEYTTVDGGCVRVSGLPRRKWGRVRVSGLF